MAATATRRVVREIPKINVMSTEAIKKLLKVAAYARVSTGKEEQEDSFELQVAHYTQLIQANSEWEFAGIYADPGISGTRAEKRPEFMRMIDDCRAGKIERVLVKSISRFARNTVDALQYIRELKDLGISIYFENENIDTMTAGGEVLITILAAMAEQESRTMSTNIKWAWQKKFQEGEIILNTGLMLGYNRLPDDDEDGHAVYEINEDEAEIVRRIFREYLAGVTVTRICKELEADGIPTKLGKTKWWPSVIRSILTNEKYTGNAILGKTYKPDVLTKYRLKNDGEKAPMYYTENSHPAIIDAEMFEMTKAEIERRKKANTATVGNSRFTSKYPFSGLLVCGTCGARLRRHVRRMGAGNKVASWGCCTRIVEGRAKCDSHHVREDVLERTYAAAIKKMTDDAQGIIDTVREGAQLAMEPENNAQCAEVEKAIIEVQEKALALHKQKSAHQISDDEYTTAINECSARMKELEERQVRLQTAENRYNEVKMWLETFAEHTSNGDIADAGDAMVMKTLVEQIIIHDTGIEVRCKCGVTIEQEYVK